MYGTFLNAALGLEFAAAPLAAASRIRLARGLCTVLLEFGIAAHTGAITARWMEAGRAPLASMHETLVAIGWVAAAGALLARRSALATGAGAFLAAAALAGASLFDDSVRPLVPALRSNWLFFHVASCAIAYGAFALSFAASLAVLFRRARPGNAAPTARAGPDEVARGAALVGFPFLSFGIAAGAVWANQTWGAYWGWDPKETWSLVTWLVYAAYLHARFVRGLAGRRAAWFSVVGFACVLFTFFGVTYLLPGLHAYAAPEEGAGP